jgi:hypothetical protein
MNSIPIPVEFRCGRCGEKAFLAEGDAGTAEQVQSTFHTEIHRYKGHYHLDFAVPRTFARRSASNVPPAK